MSQFKTTMQAEVRVPQEGFTQKDLKEHLSASKIPATARLRPSIVSDVNQHGGPENSEVAFIAEWEA